MCCAHSFGALFPVPGSSFAGLGIAVQPLMEAGPSAGQERVGSRLKETGKLKAIFPLDEQLLSG